VVGCYDYFSSNAGSGLRNRGSGAIFLVVKFIGDKEVAMSRPQRLYQGGTSYHVVQRGNNRQPVFFEPTDYIRYLEYLQDALLRYGVFCHAYVLMPNHVHLLLSPNSSEGISRVMSLIGNRYVQNFNHRRERSGSLWEGRHYSVAVLDDSYLWATHRYIELNPVRAGLASYPEGYYWSSYAHNALGAESLVLSPHDLYRDLAATAAGRERAYRYLFLENFGRDAEVEAIRHATRSGEPLGGPRLVTSHGVAATGSVTPTRSSTNSVEHK
jgi:putative transposase